jgi:hypothetical protein
MGSQRWDGSPAPQRRRSAWAILGAVLGGVLIVGGLVFVGVLVFVVVGLSHWSSNK